jgi:methylated-DNA-[protein]-cysteine S-methyltransferase
VSRSWWRQTTPIGDLLIVARDGVVERVQLPWDREPPSDVAPGRDASISRELDRFFAGDQRRLDVDVDLSSVSAPFHRASLVTLRDEVPWGETVTYGELAHMAGGPGAARAVGSAVASNPVPIIVPCHRVLAANGLGGYGGSVPSRLAVKRRLLELEGSLAPPKAQAQQEVLVELHPDRVVRVDRR